jgi:hypothetical protein
MLRNLTPNAPGHNGKYNNKCGVYTPIHREKYLGQYNPIFKSLLEYRMMRYLDESSSIEKWVYEPGGISYLDESTDKKRHYYIDFMAVVKPKEGNEKTVWIEVKSEKETKPPKNPKNLRDLALWVKNQSKWKAAREMAARRGAEFLVVTEKLLT